MKKLFTIFILLCAVVGAKAVTAAWDANSHTLTFNFNEEGTYDQNTINNNYKNDIATVVVIGPVTASQMTDINNFMDQNKGQSLNLFQANISVSDLSTIYLRAAKIALPKGSSLPDESVYKNGGSKWNGGNQLRYVCALSDDCSKLYVGGAQHNNYPNAIYDAMHGPDPCFPGSPEVNDASGNPLLHEVVLTGVYSQTDMSEVEHFNSLSQVSTYENGVLTVSRHDYDTENQQIIGAAAAYINQYKNDITTINLADGSRWTGANGAGTLYSVSEANLAEATTILSNAGFTVNSTEVKVGSHVTVKDGVTIVTSETAGQISNTSLTDAEKDALRNATSLKLVGPFNNDPDFLTLGSLAQAVTTVDLKQALIEQGTPSYTYYYLDNEASKDLKRRVLSQDANGWYYMDNGNRVDVAEEDVRIYTAKVSGGQKLPDGWKNTLTTLYLPENSDYNVTGESFANGFTKLTTVNIPENITVLADKTFYDCNSLAEVDLPDNLKAICYQVFYKTPITDLTIPGSVEIIEYMALTECEQLESITFAEAEDGEDHHMIMKYYATFNLAKLHDIYVETSAMIDCENEAFDYRVTWGQGDVNAPFCTLHFKASAGAHYANLSHPLTADIAKDPAKFHQWLHQHYQKASDPGANGWWEFVNNGTSDDKIEGDPVTGKFLRTFSDYNFDRIVPAGVKAYAVTNLTDNGDNSFSVELMPLLVIPKRTGVILYGVANSKDKEGNPILSMSLCDIANGLPLRRDYWYAVHANDDHHLANYLWPTCVSLKPANFVTEPYTYYYLNEDGTLAVDENGNYKMSGRSRSVLAKNDEPTVVDPWDEQKDYSVMDMTIDPTQIPVNEGETLSDDDNSKYNPTVLNGFFRNFYLNYYGTTDPGSGKTPADEDFIGFFRSKKNSTMDTNHAFLRVRSDEFTDPNGMEVIVKPDTKDVGGYKAYQVEYKKEDGAPLSPDQSGYWKEGGNPDMTWENPDNWGVRPENFVIEAKFFGEPIFEDENGHATMIIRPEAEPVKDPYYYTLQGVRIAKPTVAGVYIHNGKKVVIK